MHNSSPQCKIIQECGKGPSECPMTANCRGQSPLCIKIASTCMYYCEVIPLDICLVFHIQTSACPIKHFIIPSQQRFIPSQQRWRGYSNAAVRGWLGECVRGSVTLYLVDTIATTVFAQSLSNFTCTFTMMRGGTLLILGHRVKGQGQLWHFV